MKKLTKKQRIAIYKEAYERYDEIRKLHTACLLCSVLGYLLEKNHEIYAMDYEELGDILPEFAKMKPKLQFGWGLWFRPSLIAPRREILKKLSGL